MTERLKDPRGRRWPLQPLLDAVGVTAPHAAELAGYTSRTGHRWAAAGEIDDCIADLLATRLGEHPELVWPGWCHTTSVSRKA